MIFDVPNDVLTEVALIGAYLTCLIHQISVGQYYIGTVVERFSVCLRLGGQKASLISRPLNTLLFSGDNRYIWKNGMAKVRQMVDFRSPNVATNIK